MRRRSAPLPLTLLGLGVFLLVLAPMLVWYVEPHGKRNPLDVNLTSVFTGSGKYFDQEKLRTRETEGLSITRRVLGNVAAGERSGRAVYDVSQAVDNPATRKFHDPRRSFQWDLERWVTDRKTNLPVQCCGLRPADTSGEAYLKWPFDVRERTYIWWDSTLGKTVPVRYTGRQKIKGYEGMRFTATVAPTRMGTRQVPAVLVDKKRTGQVQAEEWYANSGLEFVVDRVTGRILYAATGLKVTLRAPGGKADKVTLLQSDRLAFDDATQREAVRLAKADNRKVRLVGTTAPLVAVIAGGVLTLAGAVLLVRWVRQPREM
ncbi:DUF3068 domain-containing protein [Streptomyces sp. ODS28]|uniref:DUF3068 domain-containing protein n=1 Tax=Streptomyces sp. ODS28 TaxID=3136688 RepID=UPI0031E8F720